MKTYTIQYAGKRPDWTRIPALNMECAYLQSPDNIHSGAQIAWNEEALLVHLWAEEHEIRAMEQGPLGMPCEDSCLEFFFRPVSGDPRYFNFEFNPNCCMYLGIGQNIRDLVRLVPDDAQTLFEPTVHRYETGWEIFYRIPYRFIRRFFPDFKVESGKTIRANCYKCADLTDPPHYYSWNPVESKTFTFHCPSSFGSMKFE